MSCYDAIPGGTVFLLDGGQGVPLRACPDRDPAGCGIWIMGSADPNYAHPPAGWRIEKAINFVGCIGTGGGEFAHDYRANISAGRSDLKHPGIWLSSTSQVSFENISITSCLPALVGIDSNGNPANGQARDSVFDNVRLWASASVGCGPGMFIGSSSSRYFIRHSQIRGSTLEYALVSRISRFANLVTFTAMAYLPSSWKTGMVVGVEGVSDPSFDGGDFTITVTGAKTFTYLQTGPDATSSSGRATSDGNQAIAMNPHGAQGSSLYASDLSLYGGAIKVYAGRSSTTLDVVNIVQAQGSGPAVWVATCASPTTVNAQNIRTAEGGTSGMFAAVRSDCAREPQDSAHGTIVQDTYADSAATHLAGVGPPKTAASPPLDDQNGFLKGPLAGPIRVFAVQVGAFRDRVNANRLKTLIEASYRPVVILSFDRGDGLFYRVCVGRESSEAAARELAEKLRSSKLATKTFVVTVN